MKKRMTITEQDWIKAHRKASREEEIMLHGRPLHRSKPHRSPKTYNRKNQKAALKKLPFEFYAMSGLKSDADTNLECRIFQLWANADHIRPIAFKTIKITRFSREC